MSPKKRHPRKRGQIIPKGDGKWLVRFPNGKDSEGRRLYPSKLVEGTFSQAQKALTKLLNEADTQTYVQPSKILLKEHCEAWLKTKVSLGPKTLREYRNRMEKDVYPVLGMKTLASVSGPLIQSWCSSLTSRGLSSRTVEFSHCVLSQAMKYAVRHGIIFRNPCEFTELPRRTHTEQKVFSPVEAALFIENTRTSSWHPLWALMLTSGLRPQEALALQWADVDLDARLVSVRRALVEVEPGTYEARETKTKNSRRTVSIPEQVCAALKIHRVARGVLSGLVFCNAAGHHYDLSPVRKAWHRDIKVVNAALAEANDPARLPDIKLYGARHSHLTHLLMMGVHPKAASSRAGHSNINVTMDTYSHVLPEVDQAAGDQVGVLLFKPAKEA